MSDLKSLHIKCVRFATITALIASAVSANASLGNLSETTTKPSTEISPRWTVPSPIVRAGIYKSREAITFEPTAFIYGDETEPNVGGLNISVDAGEKFLVEYMNDGSAMITLRYTDEDKMAGNQSTENDGDEDDDNGELPDKILIDAELVSQLGELEFVAEGDARDLYRLESGIEGDKVAARGRGGRVRHRRHRVGGLIKRGGRYVGRNGNCVRVVKAMTGIGGKLGNGHKVAASLQGRGWRPASLSSHQRGDVCSWRGGRHGKGHTAYFDGRCFQPTYGGNCGNPGRHYRLFKCVRRR